MLSLIIAIIFGLNASLLAQELNGLKRYRTIR